MFNKSSTNHTVTIISKTVITKIAPEELPYFNEFAKYYINKKTYQSDLLSSGIDLKEIITPIVIALISDIVKTFPTLVKRQTKSTPITKNQLLDIKRILVKQAIEFGVKPRKATQIANAVIGVLTLKQ